MYQEIKKQYENSGKEKRDRVEYQKAVHSNLMKMADVKSLMEKSSVNRLVVEESGIYVELETGIKLYMNENDYMEVPVACLCGGDYEPEETGMVKKILSHYKEDKNFTVFDIGANIGWYSLNILNMCPHMKVFSFEPSPVTYGRLKRNFELNGLSTEGLVNLGFYKENGTLDFYYDTEESGASSLVNLREKEGVRKDSVQMVKLDDWAAEHEIDRLDFIKCDVEGSEFFVYQGGAKTIDRCRPIIFSEMLRKWCEKFNYHPNDIIGFLGGCGYDCFVISGDRLARIDTVTEATVETNYFFLHKEKHGDLIRKVSVEKG